MLRMNVAKEDQGFITRLEQLKFDSENSNNPSLLADAYRSLYLHLTEADVKKLDRFALQIETGIYLRKLANVVDCMDESGMNNYAEGALALCSHHKNESSRWESALTAESILQMSAFQDLKPNEAESEDDPIIPLRNKVIAQVHGTTRANDDGTSDYKAKETSNQQRLPSGCTSLPFLQVQESANTFNQRKPCNLVSTSNDRKDGRDVKGENLDTPFQPSDVGKTSQVWQRGGSQQLFQSTTSASRQGNFSFKAMNQGKGHVPSGFSNYGDNVYGEMNSNFEVNSNKYGGPFANFGQKRKVQSNWDNCQKSSNSSWQNRDGNEGSTDEETRPTPFKTAKQQFIINQQKKFGNTADKSHVSSCSYGSVKKSLGTRRGPASKFVPPVLNRDSDEIESPCPTRTQPAGRDEPEEPVDERLKGIDPKMIELINNEIMDHGAVVTWSDVAGLEFAKKTIKEIVVWPMLRPDIFTGLRGPPKGLLLFGPPGTGKTLIGKCIASQSKSTFFCISASSLTSKWVGEGEKMVRALFVVARCNQPAVVFIDEIDSLLSQRSDSEHESSRRIKTEFLVQLDGAATGSDDRILVIGATNRPQEIDEAARRRFVKRLLIPLPEAVARKQIVVNLMSQQNSSLSESDIDAICSNTDGYSGADMSNLCREAALGPIRSIPVEQMETITPEQVRPMLFQDFEDAMRQVRASVSPKDLELYTEWNKTYGSFGF